MIKNPLISSEIFDYLRELGIEPYTKLSDSAREHLGDGVRLVALFAGESFITPKSGLRITVLSGKVRMEPASTTLDLESTRQHTQLTLDANNMLIAEENAVLLLADAAFLDTLSSWTELAAFASDDGDEDLLKRLLAVSRSLAFQRLPLEHVMDVLKNMTPRKVKAGDVIVTQGERGDAFYLIWSGRAEVWRAGIYDDEQKHIVTLGPKDCFGDEALVVGGNRNATVKMVEDGELLVLGDQDFRNLISRPLVEEVAPTDVVKMLAEGWKPVDVRYEEEFEDGHIAGSIHLPLPDLRERADSILDKNDKYISICLSGKRSTVATFLLRQRGFEVVTMKEGLSSWEGETVC